MKLWEKTWVVFLRFGVICVICVIGVISVISVIFVKGAGSWVRWKHGVAICIAYGLFVLAVKSDS